jgi:hypothetical protein
MMGRRLDIVSESPGPRLTPVDRAWRDAELIPVREAQRLYNVVRGITGNVSDVGIFSWDAKKDSASGFATVGAANSKMGKSKDLLIGGITTLPARSARTWLTDTDGRYLESLAGSLWLTVDEVRTRLGRTVCPHSTKCTVVCLITEAGRDEGHWDTAGDAERWMSSIKRTQLARLILTLCRPSVALTLELEMIRRTADLADRLGRGFRWRVNVADDIAREANPVYAATLAELRERYGRTVAYSYTKRADRVTTAGHYLCLSATEKTTDAQISARLESGGTVAVPLLGIRKGQPMPGTYRGFPLADGDTSDDRTTDPAGHVIGLRVKGRRAPAMAHGGFLREWSA